MKSFVDQHKNLLEKTGKLFRCRTDEKHSQEIIDPVILEVEDLKMHFPVFGGVFRRQVASVKAVDGVSFAIRKGETLGLVGESGCGKSTIGRTLVRLYQPTSGRLIFHTTGLADDGKGNLTDEPFTVDLARLNRSEIRPFRAEIQMIFQDPYSSLNPRLTVGDIISEPMKVHPGKVEHRNFMDKVVWLLEKVGLGADHALRYPHEFSGGQRQRIGIARALSTNPRLIIADEPVSALDVSVQAQVINLMQDLQEEFGLTFIFVAHDLSVVKHISHRIAVMYLGNIVEIGPAEEVYHHPKHSYTKALLSAVPHPDPARRGKKRQVLSGDVPSPLAKPSGCGFRTRCPNAAEICGQCAPAFSEVAPGHFIACHFK